MANIKYADPSYTDTNATDDDRVMLRTSAGADARAPLVQPKGYIDGLRLTWVSATQVQVSPGAAYIPGLKRIVELPSTLTKTPALAASTWYHIYLWLNGASADVEVVTTAPAAPYSGTARSKTGDTTRRYVGSVRTDGSGGIYRFQCDGALIRYMTATDIAPFRVVAAGTATTPTTVDLSPVMPVTTRLANMSFINIDTGLNLRISIPEVSASALQQVRPSSGNANLFHANDTQKISYNYSSAPTGSGAFIDVVGYWLER